MTQRDAEQGLRQHHTHREAEGLSRTQRSGECELTGELRRLPVREHGGEPGEAVPVAVEDGVPGRRLTAKLAGMSRRHASQRSMAGSHSPAEDGGEHAVVRVPDQRRLQLGAPLPHVHNVHLQRRPRRQTNTVSGQEPLLMDREAEPRSGRTPSRVTHIAASRGAEPKQEEHQEDEEAAQGGHGRRVTSSPAAESKTKLTRMGTGAGVEWCEREEEVERAWLVCAELQWCVWVPRPWAVAAASSLALALQPQQSTGTKERLGRLPGWIGFKYYYYHPRHRTVAARIGLFTAFVLPWCPDAATCSSASRFV